MSGERMSDAEVSRRLLETKEIDRENESRLLMLEMKRDEIEEEIEKLRGADECEDHVWPADGVSAIRDGVCELCGLSEGGHYIARKATP